MASNKLGTSGLGVKRSYKDDISSRIFNTEWIEKFLCIEGKKSRPTCLVCNSVIAVPKKFNVQRHYNNHNDIIEKYPEGSVKRTEYIKKKTNSLLTQQSIFTKQSNEKKDMVLTSYEIAFLLAKCGKPYSDGEIIKKSFDIFAKNANDSKISTYVNDISLSRNTIMRRIDEISSDISKQISCSTTNSKYFSLALDESCDITDNPQLSIFIRSVNSKFEVTEELLGLEVLETSTKGTDIFNKLKCCVETLLLKSDDLIWSKLESVCTDGAPCMIGKNIGCVTLLEEFLNRNLNKYHCIIHLEALCAKILKFDHVLKPVSRCINKIKARPLNHRLFRTLFEDAINESGELLLFCEVRWLAKGKALERFWNLKDEVIEFLEKNNELPDECELLKDKNWLINLAFLTDILGHLNILNKRLQGEGNLFPALVGSINSFMSRLRLFESNLGMGNLDHFVRLKSIYLPTDIPLTIFKNHISSLNDNFQERFSKFKEEEDLNNLFINPFIIETHDLQKYNPNMQLEIIELQSSTVLKCKYKESSEIIEFWKCLPEEDFPELHNVALKLVCRFGSTYICEKSFSRMTFIKNKYRTKLTNSHLKNLMLLSSTKLKPNYEEIISMKQIQHT